MKIAIISDSHDNWPNILTALKFIEKRGIDLIIHCGDICSGEIMAVPDFVLLANLKSKRTIVIKDKNIAGIIYETLEMLFDAFESEGRGSFDLNRYLNGLVDKKNLI